MGTRNLTIVIADGERKVAQHGQWDGHPTGQGLTIQKVIGSLHQNGLLPEFTKRLDHCRFVDDDEAEQVWKETPTLQRDMGAKVLMEIARAEADVLLADQYEFAADSLMCEFAYVIDMDNEKLEIYRGFNKSPLSADERFYVLQSGIYTAGGVWGDAPSEPKPRDDCDNYYPVKLWKTIAFDELKTVSMQALEDELYGGDC